MKFAAVFAIAVALAGCQQSLTLEQAQAQCLKKGGLLVVIYTQQISASGLEPEVASPGDCIPPKKFDPAAAVTPPASAPSANSPATGSPVAH